MEGLVSMEIFTHPIRLNAGERTYLQVVPGSLLRELLESDEDFEDVRDRCAMPVAEDAARTPAGHIEIASDAGWRRFYPDVPPFVLIIEQGDLDAVRHGVAIAGLDVDLALLEVLANCAVEEVEEHRVMLLGEEAS